MEGENFCDENFEMEGVCVTRFTKGMEISTVCGNCECLAPLIITETVEDAVLLLVTVVVVVVEYFTLMPIVYVLLFFSLEKLHHIQVN